MIGSGTILWLFLLILSVFGFKWVPWEQISSSTWLIPLLSVTYVLGIITDRFADSIFKVWDRPLRRAKFVDSAQYHEARNYVYSHASEIVVDLFEYGRSRLRICRGWAVNCPLLAIAVSVFVATRLQYLPLSTRLAISLLSLIILGVATIATWEIWRRLAKNEYTRLAEMSNLLKKERATHEPS